MRRLDLSIQLQVVDLYRQGLSLLECGGKFGISAKCVSNALERSGVRRRPRYAPRRLPHDQIVADYQSGLSFRELASKYERSVSAITDILATNGIPRRSRSESHTRHSLDHNAFDRLTDESAYWIGFLLADGCVASRSHGHKQNTLTINLKAGDRGHLEKLRAFLKASSPVREYHYTYASICTFGIVSSELVNTLIGYGIVPRKSMIATVDSRFQNDARFWRGVVDGDGSLGMYRSEKSESTQACPIISLVGTQSVVNSFAAFVSGRLGIDKIVKKNRNIWKVDYAGRSAIAVSDLLYLAPGPSLDRKRAIANNFKSYNPKKYVDWSKITREQLIESFNRLKRWSLVACELGVSEVQLKVYKSQKYGIYSRHRKGRPLDIPSCGKPSACDNLTAEEVLSLHDKLGGWAAVGRHLKASVNTIKQRFRARCDELMANRNR